MSAFPPNYRTQETEQAIQNLSFDKEFGLTAVMLVGYDPISGTASRLNVTETGSLNTDSGTNLRKLLDYDVRTDSNPVYVGYAVRGTDSSESTWLVNKITYDVSSRITEVASAYGSWDGRASLTYS